MGNKISKKEAMEKIESFFEQEDFSEEDVKKIKTLAMKYNIKLGNYRKKFCKKCFCNLRNGEVRVTKCFKSVKCEKCGFKNRWKI